MSERPLLDPRAVRLDATATGREDAIRQCADALIAAGAVEPGYAEAMLEREESISTYLGEGVALPHGTAAGKDLVRRDALAVLRFPAGTDWGGERVTLCVAVAARGDGHLAVLAELAEVLMDPVRSARLRGATTVEEVTAVLRPQEEDAR